MSGGWTFDSRYIVKMYWADTRTQDMRWRCVANVVTVMPGAILDIEQQLPLLELEAPFDKRDVQLARRRMAKRWHPDVAPRGASSSTSAT